MRVFLTGATGYIGSAVLEALVKAGHEVTALVRNQAGAERLRDRAARCVTGDLSSWDGIRAHAEGHDAYVHTAFEWTARGPELDSASVEELIGLARRAGAQALVYTSGIWVLGPTTGRGRNGAGQPRAAGRVAAGGRAASAAGRPAKVCERPSSGRASCSAAVAASSATC